MSKLKKVWNENKILFVLGAIILVCLIVVIVVSLTFFYGSSESPYGHRLDIMEKVPLKDDLLKDLKNTLESTEKVSKASVTLQGKVVYFIITYEAGTDMEKAKEIANSTLEKFSDEELGAYDLQYTISDTKYTLMGAHNSNSEEGITWSNYNIKEEESKEE